MVLGFAIVAVFTMAVVATIVSTVGESSKPQDPALAPPSTLIYEYPRPPIPNSMTSWQPLPPDYTEQNEEMIDIESEGTSQDQSTIEDPDDYGGQQQNVPQYPYPYQYDPRMGQMANYPPPYPPPYQPYPPFPGPGYIAGAFGSNGQQQAMGQAGSGSNTGKAFVPFFGYVDPILIIAIVAFPVLGTLGITSLLMPIIPIVIYIISLIFPTGSKMKVKANKLRRISQQFQKTNFTGTPLISDDQAFLILQILEYALKRFDS